MVVQCNSTLAELRVEEDPLWPAHSGITFHELGLGLSIIFGLISIIVAFYLIYRHATHYLVPSQQKHIIRILLMIPIYSTVSFLSVLYYTHAVYFQVLRDCYEAFAIASFFALMCEYVAPGLHEQKKFFRTLTPVNWFWGVFFMQKCTGGEHRGPFRKPRSGLTWFNVVWAGVFQYCLVRVTFTIVSVITEAFGRYCEHSLNPAFAHVWVICIEGASVTVAMFCLVQFYIQLKEKLSEYRPALKIICIKLVIFFSFWQTVRFIISVFEVRTCFANSVFRWSFHSWHRPVDHSSQPTRSATLIFTLVSLHGCSASRWRSLPFCTSLHSLGSLTLLFMVPRPTPAAVTASRTALLRPSLHLQEDTEASGTRLPIHSTRGTSSKPLQEVSGGCLLDTSIATPTLLTNDPPRPTNSEHPLVRSETAVLLLG